MNSNLMRYRIGRRVLVKRNDWVIEGADDLIEVEILAKSSEGVKVKVISGGWWIIGTVLWLSTNNNLKEYWIAMASVPQS